MHRLWITEPGMWAQWDWGAGPVIAGRRTNLLLCAAGVVEVPAGDRDLGPYPALGPHPAHGERLSGSGDDSPWRHFYTLVDRQREHRHDRPRRWDAGQASEDRRGRRALRDHGGDVCAGGHARAARAKGVMQDGAAVQDDGCDGGVGRGSAPHGVAHWCHALLHA